MAPYDGFIRKFSQGYFSQDAPNETIGEEEEVPESVRDKEKIFVNQSLDLSLISCYGFDMDYTLCEYISPSFDQLGCSLTLGFLVEKLGYSPDILRIKYDPAFSVRGLWFDKLRGNLMKVDQFGEILQCFHGFSVLNSEEITAMYPGKLQINDKNIYIMNTLFNLPETFLISALVDYFDSNEEFENTVEGWTKQDSLTSFAQVFQDVRTAVDDIHLRSLSLKKAVVRRPEEFVRRDARLGPMLAAIRRSGRRSFLLTNSDWWYTNNIMTFLLGEDWRSHFDWVVVDACKPKYFSVGTPLHLVSAITGEKSLAPEVELLQAGCETVLSGGDAATLTRILGLAGHHIIYCGDHLYADIIKCRQLSAWRTLLIIPELSKEMSTSHLTAGLLDHLARMESLLAKHPKLPELRCRHEEAVTEFDRSFCQTGSLFRSGDRLSFFGAMVSAWSELYTGEVCNILSYSLDHRFLMHPKRLVHEVQDRQDVLKQGITKKNP